MAHRLNNQMEKQNKLVEGSNKKLHEIPPLPAVPKGRQAEEESIKEIFESFMSNFKGTILLERDKYIS